MSLSLSLLASATLLIIAGCFRPLPEAPLSLASEDKNLPARALSSEGMSDLSPTLRQRLRATQVPAMAAATIVGDRVTAAGVAGVRKHGDPTPVTLSDKFHIGSCTKSMTATMAAVLVEEGLLQWDTTVGDVFQGMEIHPEFRRVTLTQLLSHGAGLPATDFRSPLIRGFWSSTASGPDQRLKLAATQLKEKPAYRPGSGYIYANSGFVIAGVMCEKVSGKTWPELIRSKIFQPLGMTTAGFRAPASKDTVDQPWGHKANAVPVRPVPYGDLPDALGPAGAVHCSILDWAKYVHYHLLGNPEPVLKSRQTLEYLHQIHNRTGHYALGWNVTGDSEHGQVLHHIGTNQWWYAKVWMAPRSRKAVIVVANSGTAEAADLVLKTLGVLAAAL